MEKASSCQGRDVATLSAGPSFVWVERASPKGQRLERRDPLSRLDFKVMTQPPALGTEQRVALGLSPLSSPATSSGFTRALVAALRCDPCGLSQCLTHASRDNGMGTLTQCGRCVQSDVAAGCGRAAEGVTHPPRKFKVTLKGS